MLDILACPTDKNHPLELYVLKSAAEDGDGDGGRVVEGALFCVKCSRFYPVIDEIPVMLPDDHRNKDEEFKFLQRWKADLPDKIINNGKPWHL